MYDVIVIGAGPSGLNASRRMAERGLNIIVIEQKSEIGKNIVCTGVIGQEAFREFDLSEDSLLKEIRKIKVVSPYASFLNFEHPHSFAYVVDREKFDVYLGREAQSKGVEIELNNQVVDILTNKNNIEVITKKDEKYHNKYSAKMVIIATGSNYKLHKKLGLGYPRDFINGIQAEIKINNVDYTHVFIGNDIAPGGFAWVVPVGEEKVRIGLITEKNPKAGFFHLVNRLCSDGRKNLDAIHTQFKHIAQGLVSKTYGERVLTVGEAAGQVKTTTGGGIYFGLVCSEIVSQVVHKSFDEGCFTAETLAEYEKLWKRVLKKEIIIGYYARKIYRKLSDIQIEKIIQIAQNDGFIPLIREKGSFDWHSELILALLKRIPLRQILSGEF